MMRRSGAHDITVSRRVVGPYRSGSHPDRLGPTGPAGQDVPRRSLWHRARALNDRIENCWIGDLIGVAALFAFLILLTFIVGVLE
ncbi:hypothetical protein Q9299_05285 [Gemmobacter fulvus]|uniref:hypothetical protein n=1 Tax=Gemmobacter fulvus TaxID=2840474 RepID=UPI0027964969|nr:hypothetical protein [Gemmobacter fulvus]MDQ1847696.1 hypothetical protein [Gemmobacter fulvus]